MRLNAKHNGASILEFLIVAPVILLLAWTALEFGAIFVRTNTLTKSVQSAARFLSEVHDVSDTQVAKDKKTTIAKNLVVYADPLGESTAILPGLTTNDVSIDQVTDPDHVIVTVVYAHYPVLGNGLSGALNMVTGATLDLSMNIPASSTMRYVQ